MAFDESEDEFHILIPPRLNAARRCSSGENTAGPDASGRRNGPVIWAVASTVTPALVAATRVWPSRVSAVERNSPSKLRSIVQLRVSQMVTPLSPAASSWRPSNEKATE